ncbi:aminotransferase [Mycena rebaudengoi]|nr:aminotransferase [Mycena rebaudengoi]
MIPIITLESRLSVILDTWTKRGMPLQDLVEPAPSTDVDLFSCDYLSLSGNQDLRSLFLSRLTKEPRVMGYGSRLIDGNTSLHVSLEQQLAKFFKGPSSLVFNSGSDANSGMWSTLPQPGDVVIYDELVHASMFDGFRSSPARPTLLAFKHNSVEDLRAKLNTVMDDSTRSIMPSVFILVDSLYSMHGDFAPVREICKAVKEILPSGTGHVFVDEAHTTGIMGPNGRGLVCALGLENEVSLRLYTFSKGMGTSGAVIVCSPIIRKYLINGCRKFIFSTAGTSALLMNMETTINMIQTEDGQALREKLEDNTLYARKKLTDTLSPFPKSLLALNLEAPEMTAVGFPSPIIPIHTPRAHILARHLTQVGYPAARPMMQPVVPKGHERLRMMIHAANTRKEIDDFIDTIAVWAKEQQEESA